MTTYSEKSGEQATGGFSIGTAIFFAIFWVVFFIPGLIFKSIKKQNAMQKQKLEDAATAVQKANDDAKAILDAEELAEKGETSVLYTGFDLPEISKFHSIHFLGDYDRIFLRLYPVEGVITRSVRTVVLDDEGYLTSKETKKGLENFTKESAAKTNFEFSLAGALDFTCKELAKEVRIPTPSPKMEAQEIVDMPSQAKKIEMAVDERPMRNAISETVGVVLHAGTVEVEVENRAPYSVFEVRLKSMKGETFEFRGVELKNMFEAHDFKLGDKIRLVKEKSQKISTNKDGKSNSYSKNSYSVFVLQSS